jgi:hypothetical protein
MGYLQACKSQLEDVSAGRDRIESISSRMRSRLEDMSAGMVLKAVLYPQYKDRKFE